MSTIKQYGGGTHGRCLVLSLESECSEGGHLLRERDNNGDDERFIIYKGIDHIIK